jgi:hypothetical protein
VGKLFTLDPAVVQIAADGFDDLIDQLGKDCVLVYPPTATPAGVAADPFGDKPPSTWTTGGRGAAPWHRDATGTVASPPTATVRLLINWQPKDAFVLLPDGTAVPSGSIETKGYLTDLDQVMAADFLLAESALEGRLRLKFQRDGDPVDRGNIVQGRYFTVRWRRVP